MFETWWPGTESNRRRQRFSGLPDQSAYKYVCLKIKDLQDKDLDASAFRVPVWTPPRLPLADVSSPGEPLQRPPIASVRTRAGYHLRVKGPNISRMRIPLWRVVVVLCFFWPLSAAGPRWIRMPSADFEIYSSAGEGNTRETLQYFERVRSFFEQTMGASPAKLDPIRIIMFGSEKEFDPYRFNEVAGAYYTQAGGRDYIVLGKAVQEPKHFRSSLTNIFISSRNTQA